MVVARPIAAAVTVAAAVAIAVGRDSSSSSSRSKSSSKSRSRSSGRSGTGSRSQRLLPRNSLLPSVFHVSKGCMSNYTKPTYGNHGPFRVRPLDQKVLAVVRLLMRFFPGDAVLEFCWASVLKTVNHILGVIVLRLPVAEMTALRTMTSIAVTYWWLVGSKGI